MAGSDRNSVQMEDFSLCGQVITVQVNVTGLCCKVQRFNVKLVVYLGNDCMILSDAHASDFNIVCRFASSFSDSGVFLVNFVVDSSAKLWIFVKI